MDKGEMDQDVIDADSGEVVQTVKAMPAPILPSQAEIEAHNLTHWPYANWCPHCVMARRNNSAHPQAPKGTERSVPLLVLDYCFIRNACDQDLVTLLIGKLYPVRRTFVCVLDMKGTDMYAAARLSEFIRSSGLTKCVYKTDQERAITSMTEATVQELEEKVHEWEQWHDGDGAEEADNSGEPANTEPETIQTSTDPGRPGTDPIRPETAPESNDPSNGPPVLRSPPPPASTPAPARASCSPRRRCARA